MGKEAEKSPSALVSAKRKITKIGPLYDFQQQECWSCILITRPTVFACTFILLGLLCLILCVVWIGTSTVARSSTTYRYDNLCRENSKCTFLFELEEDLDAPVYLYYRIENYYQAYRKYITSKSYSQLQGTNANDYDSLGSCSPRISEDDEDSDTSAVFLPCGLVGTSYFNDTFLLLDDGGRKLDQSSKDVNIPSDTQLYEDPGADTEGIRIVDSFENPLLMVWMRVAALPNFLKLYAIIDEDLPKGLYQMEVKNHYPVKDYGAQKFFKLATTSPLGGRSFFIGFALFAVALILLSLSCFICLKACLWPRKLGNISYLDWDNPH